MEEHIMTVHHEGGGSHSWWVGEGFGLVMTYDPIEQGDDDA